MSTRISGVENLSSALRPDLHEGGVILFAPLFNLSKGEVKCENLASIERKWYLYLATSDGDADKAGIRCV